MLDWPEPSHTSPTSTSFATADHWVRQALADLIFSGVFERHPRLRVVSAEHEVGWLPFFVERMDYTYTQRATKGHRFADGRLPSDFVRENVWVQFCEDPLAAAVAISVGSDRILWGSDYPHSEGLFPRSREVFADRTDRLDDAALDVGDRLGHMRRMEIEVGLADDVLQRLQPVIGNCHLVGDEEPPVDILGIDVVGHMVDHRFQPVVAVGDVGFGAHLVGLGSHTRVAHRARRALEPGREHRQAVVQQIDGDDLGMVGGHGQRGIEAAHLHRGQPEITTLAERAVVGGVRR